MKRKRKKIKVATVGDVAHHIVGIMGVKFDLCICHKIAQALYDEFIILMKEE